MFRNFIFFYLFFFTITSFQVLGKENVFSEKDEKTALKYLRDFLNKSYEIAKETQKDETKRSQFSQIIVNNFDLTTMAKSILGPYGRSFNAKQLEAFKNLLTKYFLKSYGTKEKIDLFASADIGEGKIQQTPSANKKRTRLTYSGTFKTNKGSVSTIFVLVKKSSNDFEIFDIKIENIGLIFSTRDQISTLHNNQKISPDEFLKVFEQKIAE